MIYTQLFERLAPGQRVRAGVIGTGQYATAIITQSSKVVRLEVLAAADLNTEAARNAFRRAGYSDDQIAMCESRAQALTAIEGGRRVVVEDALLLMDLPLDVIVESTGVAEAGALHAREAIRHGKHVAMVTKETDVTVGPILKHLADRAGLVYTTIDGDQPGLLIGLVAWARELGLEVVSGGKALDPEYVYHPGSRTVACEGRVVSVGPSDVELLDPVQPGEMPDKILRRAALLRALPQIRGSDLAEMAIVANATGLMPDVPELHCPPLHTSEIVEVMSPQSEGGMLTKWGVVDAAICLRHPYEPGLGGGVFIVVACGNEYSRYILTTKGLIPNRRDSTALIFRPYHLCGVETPISILCAGLLGVPTGAWECLPRADIVARTTRDLYAGETLGHENSSDFRILIQPARPASGSEPLPVLLGHRATLAADVPRGTILTVDMVTPPENSTLWLLRKEQDAHFFQRAS